MSQLAVIEHSCVVHCLLLQNELFPSNPTQMIPPRGCAYIVMVHRQDANRALQKLSRGNFKVNQKSIKVMLGNVSLSKAAVITVILSHLCWPLGYFRLICVLEMIFCKILKKYTSELVLGNYCSWSVVGLVELCISFLERLPIIISLINRKGVVWLITGDWHCVFLVASYLSPNRVSLHMIILQRVLINKEMCIH